MDKHHLLYKNMVLAAGTRAAVDFGVKRRLSLQTKPAMALSKYSQVMREAIEACLNIHYQETNKQFRLFKTSGFFIENNERIPAAPTPKQIPIPILSKQIPNTTPKLMPIGK